MAQEEDYKAHMAELSVYKDKENKENRSWVNQTELLISDVADVAKHAGMYHVIVTLIMDIESGKYDA